MVAAALPPRAPNAVAEAPVSDIVDLLREQFRLAEISGQYVTAVAAAILALVREVPCESHPLVEPLVKRVAECNHRFLTAVEDLQAKALAAIQKIHGAQD